MGNLIVILGLVLLFRKAYEIQFKSFRHDGLYMFYRIAEIDRASKSYSYKLKRIKLLNYATRDY